jgi:hypothetical protein
MNFFKKVNYAFCLLLMISSSTAMAHMACKIKEQSGSGAAMWCSNHHKNGIIRCYAKVEYLNGEQSQIWGDECYDSYGDCWASGAGSVEPRCSK